VKDVKHMQENLEGLDNLMVHKSFEEFEQKKVGVAATQSNFVKWFWPQQQPNKEKMKSSSMRRNQ